MPSLVTLYLSMAVDSNQLDEETSWDLFSFGINIQAENKDKP